MSDKTFTLRDDGSLLIGYSSSGGRGLAIILQPDDVEELKTTLGVKE